MHNLRLMMVWNGGDGVKSKMRIPLQAKNLCWMSVREGASLNLAVTFATLAIRFAKAVLS